MAPIAIVCGLLMVGLSLIGYFSPELLGEGAANAPTALIPAYMGGALTLCGLITLVAPGSRKHVMHLAALIGVFGAIGGFVPMIRAISKDEFSLGKSSILVGLGMTVISIVFVILCVRSFIAARKARQSQTQSQS